MAQRFFSGQASVFGDILSVPKSLSGILRDERNFINLQIFTEELC